MEKRIVINGTDVSNMQHASGIWYHLYFFTQSEACNHHQWVALPCFIILACTFNLNSIQNDSCFITMENTQICTWILFIKDNIVIRPSLSASHCSCLTPYICSGCHLSNFVLLNWKNFFPYNISAMVGCLAFLVNSIQ